MSVVKFLGSIIFAIILIAAAALFTIVGTLVEYKTGSHQTAALLAYSHPLFKILIWGFFVNILVSALLRWPFQKKHVPFLITHLGLLMLIGGVVVKGHWGLQGTIVVAQDSKTHEMLLDDTYAILLEKRDPSNKLITTSYLIDQLPANPEFTVESIHPNSKTTLESWIKGDSLYLTGRPRFAVHDWKDLKTSTPVSGSCLISADQGFWKVVACRVSDITEAAKSLYLQDLKVTVSKSDKPVYAGPLSDSMRLNFSFSPFAGFLEPYLEAKVQQEQIFIPLHGPYSLLNFDPNGQIVENFTIDLQREPVLAFLQDDTGDTYLFAFDAYGRVFGQIFSQSNLNSYVAYDDGFGGYALQAYIPNQPSRKQLEQALYEKIPNTQLRGLHWILLLSDRMKAGMSLKGAFKQDGDLSDEELFLVLAPRLLEWSEQLPEPQLESPPSKTSLLSAYLFASNLDGNNTEYNTLECPLTLYCEPAKHKNNRPQLDLKIQDLKISLPFDPEARGLKWPVLKGKYLVRFQPLSHQIPYAIQLLKAQKISYPNSQQPYSYEAELLITDSRTGAQVQPNLSMNKVYETSDHYRFYLASLNDTGYIQLIVNRDPGKYFLTYPGAVMLMTGIILLFWGSRK